MSVEQRTGDVRILLFIESRGLKGQDSEIDIVLVDISICHHSQDAFNSPRDRGLVEPDRQGLAPSAENQNIPARKKGLA